MLVCLEVRLLEPWRADAYTAGHSPHLSCVGARLLGGAQLLETSDSPGQSSPPFLENLSQAKPNISYFMLGTVLAENGQESVHHRRMES